MSTDRALATIAPRDIGAEISIDSLAGPERAAILLLALGKDHGADIWQGLDDDEIRQLSQAMARLGKVSSTVVQKLVADFVLEMGRAGALVGNMDSTEQILAGLLPAERVAAIMEEIRGPAGRNMWEKLSNVQESVLASYLKNEYPQTIAVVLSKIRPDTASRVLAVMPDDLALDVISRMLSMESIQKEILDKIEQTLKLEFMSNLAQTQRRDAHELIADIFNSFDRQTETRFMSALEDDNREAAERIKQLMFTFEDLQRLDAAASQTLLRHVEKDKLAIALKGASETIRDFFFANMSQRAMKLLQEDMEVLGPVRLRDVDEAQGLMVNLAKDLAAKGEIMISKDRGEDELVY